MTENQDQLFEQAFIHILRKHVQNDIKTPIDAYNTWQHLQDKFKNGIWEEVGVAARITAKQAHDKFHNKWTKQFYTNINPYKDKIRSIYQNCKNTTNRKVLITSVISEVQQQLQHIQFHYQTLYQFINYQIKRENKDNNLIEQQDSCDDSAISGMSSINSSIKSSQFNVFQVQKAYSHQITVNNSLPTSKIARMQTNNYLDNSHQDTYPSVEHLQLMQLQQQLLQEDKQKQIDQDSAQLIDLLKKCIQ